MPRYQLSVHAEKLRKSFFRTPDPYAVVTIAGGPLSGTEVGRTETISNALNPDWTTLLYIETDASVNMPLTVAIWDDRGGGEDRLLGEAQFEATTIFQSPGRIQKQSLAGGGR
jgi:Ca2+-dependent lipid-binding protein